jgi:hypothetical protein
VTAGPLLGVPWNVVNHNLERLATATGGRAYFQANPLDVPVIYDDLMVSLRVRYVLRYAPSAPPRPRAAHVVRVELNEPRSALSRGDGRAERHRPDGRVIAEGRYTESLQSQSTAGEGRSETHR